MPKVTVTEMVDVEVDISLSDFDDDDILQEVTERGLQMPPSKADELLVWISQQVAWMGRTPEEALEDAMQHYGVRWSPHAGEGAQWLHLEPIQ